ncbi:MAG TPA: hypothetical protein VM012_11360 [Flavitalea sp.]|nr:hypothetical protein [Flavitalea sp.]
MNNNFPTQLRSQHFFYLLLVAFFLHDPSVKAQVRISGTVFDISMKRPLDAVSVLSNSGSGTFTDPNGRYTLLVTENDSIWFSYLNKPTPKYAVAGILNRSSFEIALHVSSTMLKEVMIRPRNYRQDSIQNRQDYAKAFDFTKPGISSSIAPGGGVGLDINEFINMFRFRRNRRMLAFQERLLREEADRYIDHRFNKPLIRKLTALTGADLDTFIVRYRPDIDFTQEATDYEFQEYIKICYRQYERLLRLRSELYRKE